MIAAHEISVREGNKAAKYNYAVASYVANEPSRLQNLNPPQQLPLPQNHNNDVTWLQAPPCPGATGVVNYLPCGFDLWSPVQLTPNTNVALNNGYISARTDFGPAISRRGLDRSMSGAIVNAANAFAPTYTANAERQYGMVNFDMDIATGNIFATVDTTSLGVPFLLTSGFNQMNGNLNAGGKDVVNARDMNANRNVTANAAGAGGGVSVQNTQNTAGNPINLAESMQSPRLLRDGDVLPMPTCPPDRPVPQVFSSPNLFTTVNLTDPIIGVVPLFTPAGNQWQVSLTVATVKYPAGQAGNANAAVLAGATCAN